MAKNRVPIPEELAAKILFDSDRACCVCHDKSKSIQIHHLYEDPSNNSENNLVVLCLECHNKTQLRGGVGRHLNKKQIEAYKKDWCETVQVFRTSSRSTRERNDILGDKPKEGDKTLEVEKNEKIRNDYKKLMSQMNQQLMKDTGEDGALARFLMTLPNIRKDLYANAQKKWNTGITAEMREANSEVINGLKLIMFDISKFFSTESFNGPSGKEYIENKIKQMFEWHYMCEKTLRNKGRGTMSGVIRDASVISELEKMLLDMIESLSSDLFGFDYSEWKKKWDF